jgi:hypothetical protein
MGINSADQNENGCGNNLLWILALIIIIPVIGVLLTWIWSALQFIFTLFVFLAILCVVGFIIQLGLSFLGFIIGIFI